MLYLLTVNLAIKPGMSLGHPAEPPRGPNPQLLTLHHHVIFVAWYSIFCKIFTVVKSAMKMLLHLFLYLTL